MILSRVELMSLSGTKDLKKYNLDVKKKTNIIYHVLLMGGVGICERLICSADAEAFL